MDDDVYQGSAGRSVTVTATAATGHGADDAVTGVELTITDDDDPPTVTLALSASSIDESGSSNAAEVTATLSHPATVATTITVSATAGTNAAAGDFTLSVARTLTVAAGATASTGAVSVTAQDDDVDAPDKQVTVSAMAAGPERIVAPDPVTLTIDDDEAAPTAVLVLTPSTIDEHDGANPGSATVTAVLSHQSVVATTITVSATAGTNAQDGDFRLSAARTLIVAARATASTGAVTIEAVDDDVDGPDGEVTVSGRMSNSHGAGAVADATLTIKDDEAPPAVTLSVSPSSVAENGGVATVTATLSGASAAATTITVTPVAGAYTAGSDAVIVIAAGETANASDTATVAAVDNDAHEGSAGRRVTVTASASNDVGAGAVTGGALTLTDDDSLPSVSLILSPTSISEDGGVSTVTARLSHPSGEATTVMVSATAVPPAVPGDFTLSPATTLIIAPGETGSTGAVTITANIDGDDTPNEQVTVSGTTSGGQRRAVPVGRDADHCGR